MVYVRPFCVERYAGIPAYLSTLEHVTAHFKIPGCSFSFTQLSSVCTRLIARNVDKTVSSGLTKTSIFNQYSHFFAFHVV